MNSGLLVPGHVAANMRAEMRAKAAGAPRMPGSAISTAALGAALGSRPITTDRIDSDDFVTPDGVRKQLAELQAFVDAKRKTQPEYHLPIASGWKLTILMLTIPGVTEGGLHVVDESRESKSVASPQGVILNMGPGAYSDPARFALGGEIVPWHKVGDRILFEKYDARMFQLANGQRLGFLNDTQPVGLLDMGYEVPA